MVSKKVFYPNFASVHTIIYAIDVPNQFIAMLTLNLSPSKWLGHSDFRSYGFYIAAQQILSKETYQYIARKQYSSKYCLQVQYHLNKFGQDYCMSTTELERTRIRSYAQIEKPYLVWKQ